MEIRMSGGTENGGPCQRSSGEPRVTLDEPCEIDYRFSARTEATSTVSPSKDESV